jgi:hypothetical protein
MKPLVLGVIVASILVGCGGSDSEDDNSRGSARSSAGTRLTKAEFVRRLDALCKDANPELAQIRTALVKARDAGRAGRVSVPKTLDTFAVLLRRARAVTERFETRLREIEAPRAERRFYGALVDSVEESSVNLRQQVRAAEAQDASTLSDLSVKSTIIDTERRGLFAGHGGFQTCGRG